MKLIVAVDRDWGIGYKGELLARVRADLQNFKKLTEGKTVILGSNTLSTFPGGKPLKNRTNLVLHPDISYKPEGARVMHSLTELLSYVQAHAQEDFTVVGGASVYRQLLPFCDVAYVTKFDANFPKDVWFENLDKDPAWMLVFRGEEQRSDGKTDTVDGMPFYFTEYRRIKR